MQDHTPRQNNNEDFLHTQIKIPKRASCKLFTEKNSYLNILLRLVKYATATLFVATTIFLVTWVIITIMRIVKSTKKVVVATNKISESYYVLFGSRASHSVLYSSHTYKFISCDLILKLKSIL